MNHQLCGDEMYRDEVDDVFDDVDILVLLANMVDGLLFDKLASRSEEVVAKLPQLAGGSQNIGDLGQTW